MVIKADQERCHRCGHQRQLHKPRCSHIDCGCSGFRSGVHRDLESVRQKVDYIFQSSVALELSEACSTDEEIKQEMYKAVERWWTKQK